VNGSEAPANRRVYSVKEFTSGLAAWFASKKFFADMAIAGEVSDLHPFGNGHVGFKLKEEQAIIECVAWWDRHRELPELKNGMAVIATGSIGIRQDRGCYQLVVETIEPTGLGALFLKYEKLKEKFRAEGLFDTSRKRLVPQLPRRVALISARGKAMEDFVETLARKAPFVDVTFIEAQVQGQGAEIEIAAALDAASQMTVDVIVLARGGGSYEDLFPFNLEPVVRAIVRARHPVLTAIGHSGDHHLADDVADAPFGTPSLAAEHIVREWVLALRRVRDAERRLLRAAERILLQASHRAYDLRQRLRYTGAAMLNAKTSQLTQWRRRLDVRSPQRAIGERRERLIRLSGAIQTSTLRYMGRAGSAFQRAAAGLDRVDPLAPLARGYAIVTHAGKAVKDASELHGGDAIEARFKRGVALARVELVKEEIF
jgi:exodeoxyribonuclease VII large subunit